MYPKVYHLALVMMLVYGIPFSMGISLRWLLGRITHRECERPGIVDVRVFSDHPFAPDDTFLRRRKNCTGAFVLQRFFTNVSSFGARFQVGSRINVVYARNLTGSRIQDIGTYVKRSVNYGWAAKFLFYLPSVNDRQMATFGTVAGTLTSHRMYNNLFVVNRRVFFTFNVLNAEIRQHVLAGTAIDRLFQDKFNQMSRYHIDDWIDAEIYPFHFIGYGRNKVFNREAQFITMLVDRLNMSMVERVEIDNVIYSQQFAGKLKDNSMVATFGHVLGDFRRIFTNDMDGICAVVSPGKVSTIFDDFTQPLDVHIWVMWIVCSELTVLAWCLVKWMHSPSRVQSTSGSWFRELGGLHLTLVQFCILAPPTLRNAGKLERLIAFCYMLAVFVIVTVYVSCVTSNLSTVRYRHGYETVDDLIEHQVPVVGSGPVKASLRLSWPLLNYDDEVRDPSKFVAAVTCSYGRLAAKHSPAMYRMIEKPLISHFIVYLLHRESILEEVLERYASLSYQADLYRYWDHFILDKVPIPRNRTTLDAGVIKFDEMMWLFVIVPVGEGLAFVVFLLERIHRRMHRWLMRNGTLEKPFEGVV